jgi:hypothetical protein
LASFYALKSGVPRGSALRPSLFSIFIDDIYASIHNSNYLLFANDLKTRRSVANVENYTLLLWYIDIVQTWNLDCDMTINTGKNAVIFFTLNTNIINLVTNYVTNS